PSTLAGYRMEKGLVSGGRAGAAIASRKEGPNAGAADGDPRAPGHSGRAFARTSPSPRAGRRAVPSALRRPRGSDRAALQGFMTARGTWSSGMHERRSVALLAPSNERRHAHLT